MTLQPATRATLAGSVTVALVACRVVARILHLIADLMTDAADLADRARGRGPTTAQPAAPAPLQPTLMP
jgi:hypothetical protein